MADSPPRDGLKTQIVVPTHEEGATKVPTLTVIKGPRVGSMWKFAPGEDSSLTVGRTQDSQFVLTHPTLSRVHVKFTWMPVAGKYHLLVEDQNSTNGSFVNGTKVDATFANDGDRITLGEVILKFEMLRPEELRERERLVEKAKAADLDPLSGLATRHYLAEVVPQMLAESEARGIALSILMMDLDKFKRINDTLGHPIGDKVVAMSGTLITRQTRTSDVAVRFGGEEFLVILAGSDIRGAQLVAERIRCAFSAFDAGTIAPGLRISISVGVAQRQPSESFESLLKRADTALYRAKEGGRNRVEVDVPEAIPRGPATSPPLPNRQG